MLLEVTILKIQTSIFRLRDDVRTKLLELALVIFVSWYAQIAALGVIQLPQGVNLKGCLLPLQIVHVLVDLRSRLESQVSLEVF